MTILRSNCAASAIAVAQLGGVLRLRDADARSEVGRLHEHREAEARDDRLQHGALVALPVALEHDLVVADRQALGGEHQLHRRLVHADRRREHAGADVGHVGELEQSLHRAVLAVRAVQHRKDDVERDAGDRPADQRVAARAIAISVSPPGCATRCASQLRRRRRSSVALDHVGRLHHRRRRRRQRPAAVLLDPDRDRLVALGIEVLEHRRRRGQRHLVLAGAAAVDDADAEFLHGFTACSTRRTRRTLRYRTRSFLVSFVSFVLIRMRRRKL